MTQAWARLRPMLPLAAAIGVIALIVLLVALSAGLRGEHLSPDARQNMAMSLHLRATGGFSLDGTSPTYVREPIPIAITAAYMALFTDIPANVSVQRLTTDPLLIGQVVGVNLLYEVALFLSLWWLAWRLTRSHLVAALAILGTWTFLFQDSSSIRGLLTESPAALTMVLAAATAVWMVQTGRTTAAILTGISLGAVALTKAAGLYPAVVAIPLLAVTPLLARPAAAAPESAEPASEPPPPSAEAAEPVEPMAESAAPRAEHRLSASQRQVLRLLAVTALAFVLTVTPWMTRNYVRFHHFAIAQRSGGVLLVRALKDRMTADEFKGTFYVYAPSSLRKDLFEQYLGFRPEDVKPGGRYVRLARNQPEDAAAVAAGDVDQAVSFFGMAGAMQTQIGRQLAAEGRPASELDGVLQKQAMSMIEETPGRHLVMTLPFAWRGLWAFVNGKYLIVAVCDWVAFVVFLAFPFLALWRRRADWMAFSLFGVGLFWFYALLTHFIPRYSEPLIPLAVLAPLVAGHALVTRVVRRRTARVKGPVTAT